MKENTKENSVEKRITQDTNSGGFLTFLYNLLPNFWPASVEAPKAPTAKEPSPNATSTTTTSTALLTKDFVLLTTTTTTTTAAGAAATEKSLPAIEIEEPKAAPTPT